MTQEIQELLAEINAMELTLRSIRERLLALSTRKSDDAPASKPLRDANWVAERLGVSQGSVYDLAKCGDLLAVKVLTLYKFEEEAVEEFIRKGGSPDPALDASSIAGPRGIVNPRVEAMVRRNTKRANR